MFFVFSDSLCLFHTSEYYVAMQQWDTSCGTNSLFINNWISRLACLLSHYNRLISLVCRVFANGAGYLGSIPGRVIPKTQKWYLIPPCLTPSNIRYVSRVKWNNQRKGVAPSPTPWCSSYWRGSLLVTLNYGGQLTFFNNRETCKKI